MEQKEIFQSYADEYQEKAKFLETLNSEQKKSLENAVEHMESCLQMIFECHDLYMSDISKLQSACYSLKSNFLDVEPSAYQLEAFEEHGVTWPPKK